MRFAFIEAEKAHYPVALLCRHLAVSRSGYYAWRRRRACPRRQQDQELAQQVEAIHKQSRGTYGRPRVHAELRARGIRTSGKRVGRLMRERGLCARRPRRCPRTTDSRHSLPVAPNVLDRQFTTTAPDRVWVGDITYVRTEQGWLYLAVLLDLYSRRVVGWAMGETLERRLCLDALRMALGSRNPLPGLVHHTDRGSQYASHEYRELLQARGIQCSMSRRGNCWDNAVAESFFKSFRAELTDRVPFATRAQARRAIFEYIEVFYNRRRLHSSLGYRTPAQFESLYDPAAVAA